MGCMDGISNDEKGAELFMKKTINLAFLYAILAMIRSLLSRIYKAERL